MKAAVLAGGQEFGQCPLARQMPRALWPVPDKPVIEHVLEALRSAGIGEAAVTANGSTQAIAQRLGRRPVTDVTVHYSEDSLPRGAAGCIKDCEKWLGRGTFLVVHGAALPLKVDFADIVDEHRRSGAVLTIGTSSAEAPAGCESGPLKPAGVYVCEPDIFEFIGSRGYQDVKEQLIPRLIMAGLKVRATRLRGRVIPILNEECYLNAVLQLLEAAEGNEAVTAHLPCTVPGLWIDPDATIDAHARVIGPAYIAAGARLMRDAVVVGPAVVGPECQVGPDAMVHESVLWRGACVGRAAVVEQTVMAAGSVVGAGAEVRGAIVTGLETRETDRSKVDSSAEEAAAELGSARRLWRRIWSGIGLNAAG